MTCILLNLVEYVRCSGISVSSLNPAELDGKQSHDDVFLLMWKIVGLRLLMALEKSVYVIVPIVLLAASVLFSVFRILARPHTAIIDKVMLIIIQVVVTMTVFDWVGMTQPYKFPGDDYDPTLTVDLTYDYSFYY